jgi:hypothetical protein
MKRVRASAKPPRADPKRSIAAICCCAFASDAASLSTSFDDFADFAICSIFFAILSKTAPVLSSAEITAFASIILAILASHR